MNTGSLGTRLLKRASGVAAWLLIGVGACSCSEHVSLGDLRGASTALAGGGNDGREDGSGGAVASSVGRGGGGAPASSDFQFGGSVASSPPGSTGVGGSVAIPQCQMQACFPSAPAGWLGPVAAWEGQSGGSVPLPNCPAGYADPIDLHHELDAPAIACTCTCTPQGEVCNENATLEIFDDLACGTKCATVSTRACGAVSGCSGSQGSLRAEMPKPSAGYCAPMVASPLTVTSWQYDVRLCQPSNVGNCEDPTQICTPAPASPYLTSLCVMRVILEGQALPECPTEYPNAREALYDHFSDSRGCSDCSCSSLTGGSCPGTLVLSGDSECGGGGSYSLGTGCKPFDLGSSNLQPASVEAQYTLVSGTCGIASASYPTGSAAPSGPITALCCQ